MMQGRNIILETERLYLCDIDLNQDFENFHTLMSDEETVKYIGGKTLSRAECWRSTSMLIGHRIARGYSFMSVFEKDSGAWVGRVGPWYPEGWPEPEVGWTIQRDYWRKGYAKEAGRACIDYCYERLGWSRVIHVIAEDNIGSIKTAEALGSKRLYPIKDLPPFGEVNCWAYGQVR